MTSFRAQKLGVLEQPSRGPSRVCILGLFLGYFGLFWASRAPIYRQIAP